MMIDPGKLPRSQTTTSNSSNRERERERDVPENNTDTLENNKECC